MKVLKIYLWKILSIMGLVIGLLSFYYTFVGYKYKSPNYIIKSNNLINENISKIDLLDLKVEGRKINNLTISKIAFWNSGKEVINGNDVAEAEPISIHLKNGLELIGKPIITYPLTSSNQFLIKISPDNKFFNILFDYIDYGDGLIIEFFHTGKNDDDIFIKGKIKGVREIKKVTIDLERSEFKKIIGALLSIICILISIVVLSKIIIEKIKLSEGKRTMIMSENVLKKDWDNKYDERWNKY